ncbi:hypothetical protein OQA88_12455 [Cercophora sp. LCS_1]
MLVTKQLQLLAGVYLAAFAVCTAAETGDDIANNLPTDLAPLLALFGERVTTQFMSQSMGWADGIILAMAPLGIMTVVVGAIRVGGPSWLKAIIGRARESRAVAESELMSSTSNEVCELWNGGEVVRVMGAGPIREFILLLPEQGGKSEPEEPIIAQNVRVMEMKDRRNKDLQDDAPSIRERIRGRLIRSDRGDEESDGSPVILRNTIGHEPNLVPAPNLTLNVQNQVGRGELYAVAALGIILQLGVVVFSGFTTYRLTLAEDENPIDGYALPCTAIGTLLLVAGILACAYVVETSTTESRYRPAAGKTARIVWLQRSGTVNDQAFEPFAIFPESAQPLITTSRRAREPKYVAATIGTIVSISGFATQFVGLRSMHWSAPAAQLGATIVMTVLRTLVRRNLAKPLRSHPLLPGHEMDWLAMTLAGGRESTPWMCLSPATVDTYRRPWRGEEGDKDGGWDWRIIAVENAKHCRELETSKPTDHENPIIEQLKDQEKLTAHRVMLIRRSLGALADWQGPASAEAISLARAIEATMDALFGPKQLEGTLTWSIPAAKSLHGPDREPVRFRVERLDNGRWKAYSDEIEAALSLWLYSIYEDENPKDAEGEEVPPAMVKNRKPTKDDAWLRAKGTPVKQSLQLLGSYSECLHQHLRWWMPDGAAGVLEVEKIEKATDDGTTIEVETHRIVGFMSGSSSGAPSGCQRQFYRVRPSPITTGNDATDRRGGGGERTDVVLATESYSSLATLFAQHMFSVFMWAAVKKMTKHMPGEVDIRAKEMGETSNDALWVSFTLHNSQLSKMAQAIHNTGLGSLEEIYQCVIPPLSGEQRLPCVTTIIDWTRKQARPHELRGHWKEAATVYLSLFRTARTYLQDPDIVAKATALLMECLNAVIDVLKTMEAQQLEGSDIRKLEHVKSELDNELRNGSIDIVRRLLGLYRLQGRSWGCSFIENTNPLTGEDTTLNFTELHWAAHKGDPRLTWRALSGGQIRIDEMDILNWTPVHYAAAKPSSWISSMLLERRANVNVQDAHGRTPLHYACRHGDTSTVQILVRAGADINTQDIGGLAPIHYAAIHGSYCGLESLIEAGADIDSVDILGRTALLWAISKGHANIVTRLWKDSKQRLRDHNGRTSLHLAAIADVDEASKRDDVVKVLLELPEKSAVMIESRDRFGYTPLTLSAKSGHESVVELLLDRDATADAGGGDGKTPLHWAAEGGHEATVKLLLNQNANVNAGDKDEQTPLHWAAEGGHEAVVKLLLDRDANVNAGDKYRLTPLHWAAMGGHEAVVKLLLDRDANVNAGDRYRETPLHWAAEGGHEAMVKLLLDRDANVNAGDRYGQTPLHRAAMGGHEAVVKLLLDRNATVDTEDEDGKTPLHLATKEGHGAVVKLLQPKP